MARTFSVLTLFTLIAVPCAFGMPQEARLELIQLKGKAPNEEDLRMMKLIEKFSKSPETERDRIIKELVKLAPDQELSLDFNQWFARLTPGGGDWDRSTIKKKGLTEIFDRMADRLAIKSTMITRSQFVRYAQQYWQAENAPLWKQPKEFDASVASEKMFKHFDRNKDGYLAAEEIPESLRQELRRWDDNGDGMINLDEYRKYFPHRLKRVHRQYQSSGDRPGPIPAMQPEDDDRVMVIRAGKLPTGLPAWYSHLDMDQDGQVALSEWRRAGWPLDEFKKLDLDDDGYIVPQEVLKLLAVTQRDGTRPFAYLMQLKVAKKTTR